MIQIVFERIGEKTSLTPIELKMRDKTRKNIDHNIIVIFHLDEVTHWVLVISRDMLGGN